MAPAEIVQHLSAVAAPGGSVAIHVNQPQHSGDTPLHDHDFVEFAVVLAGHAIHRTVHGARPVRAGDVLVLHPGQWHAYERCRGLQLANCCLGLTVLTGELAWMWRNPQLAPLLPAHRPGQRSRLGDANQVTSQVHVGEDDLARIAGELTSIRRLQTGRTAARDRPEVIARTTLVLAWIARAIDGEMPSDPGGTALPADVEDCVQAMEEDLAHAWGLAELATRTNQSPFRFTRRFRAALGRPPIAWLAGRRAERAAVLLLTTDAPVAEIGRRVGWADPNFFARRFRAEFAQSPRTYRRLLPIPPLLRSGEDWIQW